MQSCQSGSWLAALQHLPHRSCSCTTTTAHTWRGSLVGRILLLLPWGIGAGPSAAAKSICRALLAGRRHRWRDAVQSPAAAAAAATIRRVAARGWRVAVWLGKFVGVVPLVGRGLQRVWPAAAATHCASLALRWRLAGVAGVVGACVQCRMAGSWERSLGQQGPGVAGCRA